MGELPDAQARLIDEATAAAGSASLNDIQHVVILMQENRSFDHYFGTLSGVRGFSDPNIGSQSIGGQAYPIFDQFGYQPGKRDGRMANVDLADAISLSPSACLRRVKALEASGIIAGYHAEVSRARAGLGLTVFIGLKVEKHSQETSTRVEQALLAIPAIVACYLVSGTSDFLVEAAVPDLAGYEQLLLGQILTIPSVVEAQSTFAIRTILSRGPLPTDHWRR
jgi:Lrp/AsnC family leucine-responsive transcriptional regulator